MNNLSILMFPKALLGALQQDNWTRRDSGVEADLRAARERARKRNTTL
jgi:hypothetical protein